MTWENHLTSTWFLSIIHWKSTTIKSRVESKCSGRVQFTSLNKGIQRHLNPSAASETSTWSWQTGHRTWRRPMEQQLEIRQRVSECLNCHQVPVEGTGCSGRWSHQPWCWKQTCTYGTQGQVFGVDMVVWGSMLDLMVLKFFFNLSDSVIPSVLSTQLKGISLPTGIRYQVSLKLQYSHKFYFMGTCPLMACQKHSVKMSFLR